jgi:Pyruvate/2-oxoacid:ferredoxin oxidoreductase delta subunit
MGDINIKKVLILIIFIQNILEIFPTIKNSKDILCKNCIYFKPKGYGLDNCIKFGKLDIISGKIEYDKAYKCRLNPNSCGMEAKYFQERTNETIIENIIKQSN